MFTFTTPSPFSYPSMLRWLFGLSRPSTALVPRAQYLVCKVGIHNSVHNSEFCTLFQYTNDENHWSCDYCWGDVLTSSSQDGRVKTGFDYEGGSWFLVVQFRLY
jgi:hypothetical protein